MKVYKLLEEKNGEIWDKLVEVKSSNREGVKASAKEKFDYCIKKSFENGSPYIPGKTLQNGKDNFGLYSKQHKRYYDRYFSKDLQLENILSEKIQKSYDAGKGSEFTSGKFYSVASSSRFAIASFAENKDEVITPIESLNINGREENLSSIKFEEGLKITNVKGISPQMDVKIQTESKDIYFIEVKCHEIFDSHKTIELRWAYNACTPFRKIKECLNLEKLDFQKKIKKGQFLALNDNSATDNLRPLYAEDFGCKLKTHRFDFKQFLCHLMGIISYIENQPSEKIHFYYLFYKNDKVNECGDFSKVYEELENEIKVIKEVFNDIFEKYNIDFGYCYNDQFSTLKSLKNELKKSR